MTYPPEDNNSPRMASKRARVDSNDGTSPISSCLSAASVPVAGGLQVVWGGGGPPPDMGGLQAGGAGGAGESSHCPGRGSPGLFTGPPGHAG